MADLAVLGLQIESAQALKAANDLDKLATSANKAEKATEGAGRASEQASQRMGAGSKAVERLLQAIEKVEKAVREQNAAMARMGTSLSAVETEMMAASKAAQSIASSVSAAGAASAKASAQVETLGAASTSAAAGIAATAAGAGRMGANLQAANENVKLAAHQVANLRSQAIDIGTMLASGSSPFQVLSTQAGQVYEALASGPGGVKGALKAIGESIMSFGARLGPVGLAVGALGAAGAAAIALWPSVQDRIEKVNKAAEKFGATLRDIRRGNADLADTIEKGLDRALTLSPDALRVRLAAQEQAQRDAIEQARKGIQQSAFFSVGFNPLNWGKDAIQTVTGGIDARTLQGMAAAFVEGSKSAAELRQELDRLQATGQVPNYLKGAIDEIMELTDASVEAGAKITQLKDALENMRIAKQAADNAEVAGTAYEKFRGSAFDLDSLKTERQKLHEAFKKFQSTTMGPLNPKDVERYNEALRQIDAQDERIRKGRELDLQQVGARTVAERARIAAERERLNLTVPGIDREKVAADAAAASQMVYAEAAESSAEALRASRDAYDQAGLEGYAAQVAAINAQYARQIELAQGSEAAVRALSEARDLDLKALEVSTRKSLFDGQEEDLRRLQAEAGLVGQNDDVRRKALATLQAEADLRRQGIDLNSAWGRTYVANAQQISDLDDALGKQQEAFDDLKDAAKGFFETISSGGGILDAFANAFGKLGQQMASKGFDKLFGALLNGGQAQASGLGAISGVIAQAANQNAPVYGANIGVERTFAAPVGAVERKVLPALSSFSSGLMAAAKAIRTIESGSAAGNYSALGPITKNGDRAYGAYQVMGNNIADWSRSALGREVSKMEFLRSVELQDKIFEHRFGGYMQKYGAEGASRAWFAGEGGMRNYRAQDVVGTSVSGYGGKFGSLYGQYANDNSSTATRAYEKATERGVENGLNNALPALDGGYAGYGRTGGIPIPTARPNVGGLTGSGSILGIQYPEFSALGGLTAGLGGFGAGYSSGSALGGGLQGAVGGFMAGGPVGAVIGGIAGLLGGALGKSKQKKQEEAEAKRQWEGMQPQYEAYRRYLSGEESGNLRTDFQNIQSQFNQFNAASTKAKNGDLVDTARSFYAYVQKQLSEFREAFEGVAADLDAGAGLDGPFQKGKSAVKQLQKQLQGYLDDVAIAYFQADNGLQGGAPFAAADIAWKEQREAALATARRGAQNQALAVLNPPKELSAVENNFRSLQGAATQLLPTLQKLGLNATEAAKRISEELNKALATMASEFLDGFQRKVNDLSGLGYLNDVTDLLTEFDTALSNAKLLNVDPTLINRWFTLSAQGIVDASELTGDAFAELVRVFPQLSGVVSEFVEKTQQSAKELAQSALDTARSNLDRSYQAETDRINDLLNARRDEANELESTISKLEDFRDQVREFRDSLKLDDNLSTLNARDRVTEAGRQFQELLSKAKGGDEEARGRLTGAAQEYLNEAKGYYQTSTDYGAIFDEVSKALADTQTTTESALSAAQSQLDALKRQISLDEAQLSVAKAQYDAILGTNEGIKGLQVVLAEMAVAIAQARGQGITVPGQTGGADPVSDRSMQYLANNPDVAKAIAAGNTFGTTTGSVEDAIKAHWNLFGQYEVQKAGDNRKGYASGGYTGMGGVNDVAGLVHGQEYVMDAASTRAIGVSTLDMMRQTRSLPTIAMPASPRMVSGGNDNRGVEQRLDRLEALMRQQIATTGGGLQRVAEAGEAGARATEQRALAERRSANNKQQAA